MLHEDEKHAISLEAFSDEIVSRLKDVDDIDPVSLAQLFSMSFGKNAYSRALFSALQTALLWRTVEHAQRHTIYYKREVYAAWQESSQTKRTSLDGLPTIDRATITSHFPEFIANDVHLRSVCHTSGTTGQPLEIYKSFEEVNFIGRFFTELFQPAFTVPSRPLTLSFPTPHHGVPVPMPSPGISFVSGVTDDTLIRDALRVLSTEYHVVNHDRRISILSGMAFQVLFFTSFLLEQQIDPKSFQLRLINVAGGFVPLHWRRFLGDAWGCIVNDRFSLTETVGGASRCHTCQWFKPDPHVFFEVIEVDSEEPVDEGIGRLVVTNLYPFAQMMPLIRYVTGDIVRCRTCHCTPSPVFQFLGRARNSISSGSGKNRRWFIFSAELHEVLAGIPDLNVYEWFSNVREVKDRTVGSLPIVALKSSENSNGQLEILLSVELKYAPHCYPERLREIEKLIVEYLKNVEGSEFGAAYDSGEMTFTVQFLPPGGLKDSYIIKI
ncbi:CoF synthetase [Gloeocapsopsis sp. IPPAS B-1203]|uniref:CoF synthetase n=1 Tax=Gloeocapsopsis sp. IPPAS B-1203 TaxID=2049454 RepID=UPI000C193283|nr:CoF synthetase [Gloeocapsopsis sp. IPPAS B-1203]PIG92854.1 CoF synthetase [Gloeocapsopsis sp. IPPAS B-1203]